MGPQHGAFLPFQSFPPGQKKIKEETKRKKRGERMAIKRREGGGGGAGRAEIHTCDGEAT